MGIRGAILSCSISFLSIFLTAAGPHDFEETSSVSIAPTANYGDTLLALAPPAAKADILSQPMTARELVSQTVTLAKLGIYVPEVSPESVVYQLSPSDRNKIRIELLKMRQELIAKLDTAKPEPNVPFHFRATPALTDLPKLSSLGNEKALWEEMGAILLVEKMLGNAKLARENKARLKWVDASVGQDFPQRVKALESSELVPVFNHIAALRARATRGLGGRSSTLENAQRMVIEEFARREEKQPFPRIAMDLEGTRNALSPLTYEKIQKATQHLSSQRDVARALFSSGRLNHDLVEKPYAKAGEHLNAIYNERSKAIARAIGLEYSEVSGFALPENHWENPWETSFIERHRELFDEISPGLSGALVDPNRKEALVIGGIVFLPREKGSSRVRRSSLENHQRDVQDQFKLLAKSLIEYDQASQDLNNGSWYNRYSYFMSKVWGRTVDGKVTPEFEKDAALMGVMAVFENLQKLGVTQEKLDSIMSEAQKAIAQDSKRLSDTDTNLLYDYLAQSAGALAVPVTMWAAPTRLLNLTLAARAAFAVGGGVVNTGLNSVTQLAQMTDGTREEFSWSEAGMSGLTGTVAGGVLSYAPANIIIALGIRSGNMSSVRAYQNFAQGHYATGSTEVLNAGVAWGGSAWLWNDVILLGDDSIILDSNLPIGVAKLRAERMAASGQGPGPRTPVNPLERMTAEYFEYIDEGTYVDWRGSSKTISEIQEAITLSSFRTTHSPSHPAYQALLAKLVASNVGRGKGAADRSIVADAFFAEAKPGVTPTLMTADKGIYRPLWAILQKSKNPTWDPGKNGYDGMPPLFEVTIDGKTIKVFTWTLD